MENIIGKHIKNTPEKYLTSQPLLIHIQKTWLIAPMKWNHLHFQNNSE